MSLTPFFRAADISVAYIYICSIIYVERKGTNSQKERIYIREG